MEGKEVEEEEVGGSRRKRMQALGLLLLNDTPLGWPGGELKVTKNKIKINFLPLMALDIESQKEFDLEC